MNPARTKPSPLAELGLRLLKERGEPDKARQAQRYFKEEVKCLGISAPHLREIARNLYHIVRSSWTVMEAEDFCELMLCQPFLEARSLGILVLEKYNQQFPRALFFRIGRWLRQDFCDCWALIDLLCPTSVGALLEKYPDLIQEIRKWTGSPNRWVRRAAAVSFIKLARRGQFLDFIYDIATFLFSDKDDLVQKATGWLLREAGKRDAGRLERFLLDKGPRIPRTTLRYAIEKFDWQKRRAILEATKL